MIPSFVFGLVQVDREGIVRIDDDNAVFMSGRDDVVRYHASGITVSRMEDTGELVSTCAGGVRDGSSDMEDPWAVYCQNTRWGYSCCISVRVMCSRCDRSLNRRRETCFYLGLASKCA